MTQLRFIFSTDQHIRGTNPRHRKDHFPDTIMEKIEWVNNYAKETKAVAQLYGGDLYDIASLANSVTRRVNYTLRNSPCPIYTAIGNHEEFNYDPDSIERATIGIAESAGLLNRLSMDNPIIFEENGIKVGVTGCDSHAELDKNDRIEDYCPPRPKDIDIHIHVMHAFLSVKPRLESIPHTLIKDILEHTKADIILAGHEHTGFGVIKMKNSKGELKIFGNPGGLGRIHASREEMNRVPKLLDVIIDGPEDYDVKEVIIGCAKPSEEVLDREELEKLIEQEKNMMQFTESLNDFAVDTLDVYIALDAVAKELDVDKEVVDEARIRLGKAEEEIYNEIDKEIE